MVTGWLFLPWPGGALGILPGIAVFAAVGSLLAAASVRLAAGLTGETTYRGRSFWFGRSICPACGVEIAARDLVPVISWAILRGRCRACGTAIARDYALSEIGAVLAFLAAFATQPSAGRVVAVALLGAVLAALTIVDLRHQLLPDPLVLPLLPLGLAVAALAGPDGWPKPIDGLAGAALGGGLLWVVRAVYRRFRGIEALGLGDVKLMAVAGAWVGWQGLSSVLLVAALGTLLAIGLVRLAGRRVGGRERIPFGPGLALGCLATVLLGPLPL
ncbi:MAG: prepilin peptidase [Proteobacteria bacterium]|nr:prepilin peptidase [Pseudomonadota bacterium]MBI3498495.1 prepilin peptidase [Pseudomonadota bacterium]